MSTEWERIVRAGEDACVGCGSRFQPDQEIVTGLDFDAGAFHRADRCAACFTALPAPPFSYWRHRRSRGERAGPRRLDLGFLTEFFKRLDAKAEDPASAKVRWIVGLLLLRKRVLEEIGREQRELIEVIRVRLKREEREFLLVDPNLDAAAIASIEDDLARIFNLDEAPSGRAQG